MKTVAIVVAIVLAALSAAATIFSIVAYWRNR